MATVSTNTVLRKFLVDVGERSLFTFVATFVALYAPVLLSVSTGANWHVLLNLSFAQKAIVAGLAAVFTVVKGAVGTTVGDTSSPSLLPSWLLQLFKVGEIAVANPVSPVGPAFQNVVSAEFTDSVKTPNPQDVIGEVAKPLQ